MPEPHIKPSFKSTKVYLKYGFSCKSTIVVIQALKRSKSSGVELPMGIESGLSSILLSASLS